MGPTRLQRARVALHAPFFALTWQAGPSEVLQSPAMAFATAGKCEGLQIWRVENMTPVLIEDTALHGNFLEGCSYICLRTRSGPPAGLPEFAIHFWLGAETTPNESGAAAFRSVEVRYHMKPCSLRRLCH